MDVWYGEIGPFGLNYLQLNAQRGHAVMPRAYFTCLVSQGGHRSNISPWLLALDSLFQSCPLFPPQLSQFQPRYYELLEVGRKGKKYIDKLKMRRGGYGLKRTGKWQKTTELYGFIQHEKFCFCFCFFFLLLFFSSTRLDRCLEVLLVVLSPTLLVQGVWLHRLLLA